MKLKISFDELSYLEYFSTRLVQNRRLSAAQIKPLPPGIRGTEWTLVEIANLIRDDVKNLRLREVALRIVGGCPGHDFDCQLRECLRYVQQQVTFRNDPVDLEMISGGAATLAREPYPAGDCDDLVILLSGILGSLGIMTRLKIGSFDGIEWNHIWLEAFSKADNNWIPLDPTNEFAAVGWEASGYVSTSVYPIWPGTVEGVGARPGLGDTCCGGCASGHGCDSKKGLSGGYSFPSYPVLEGGRLPLDPAFPEEGGFSWDAPPVTTDPGMPPPQWYLGNPTDPTVAQLSPPSQRVIPMPARTPMTFGTPGSWEIPAPPGPAGSSPAQVLPFPSSPAAPAPASSVRWGTIAVLVAGVWFLFH